MGGYSARSYDTKYITPFLQRNFARISMRESGWLTRSIEQPHPFDRDFPGKIRNLEVKQAFLNIIEDVQDNGEDPLKYLNAFFLLLSQKSDQDLKILESGLSFVQSKSVRIETIIELLKNHFFKEYSQPGASLLPVIAIFSIYELMLQDVSRYKKKILKPLKDHTTSDLKSSSFGDIEVYTLDNHVFECVEVKHKIPIGFSILDGIYSKIRNQSVNRYYILTTANPNIKEEDRHDIQLLIKKFSNEGCEVIINGLIPSLNYYLRLTDHTTFIAAYTRNLEKAFTSNTVIKYEHLENWQNLRKMYLV